MVIIAAFLWAGFICAISFMESWLKFRAPGITLPLGLSVGTLVFGTLNKVEWVFTFVIVINIILSSIEITFVNKIWFALIVAILIVQTAWLLPALNNRAKAIIRGDILPRSSLHWYFIIAEFVKLAALFLFGVHLLKMTIQLK